MRTGTGTEELAKQEALTEVSIVMMSVHCSIVLAQHKDKARQLKLHKLYSKSKCKTAKLYCGNKGEKTQTPGIIALHAMNCTPIPQRNAEQVIHHVTTYNTKINIIEPHMMQQ